MSRARINELRCVELRVKGVHFEEIAIELGLKGGGSAAYKVYRRAMDKIIADTQDVALDSRELILERVEMLLRRLLPLTDVKDPSLFTVDRIVKLIQEQAKLTGAYAPTKVAPTDPSGKERYRAMSDSELLAFIERGRQEAKMGSGDDD